MPGSLFATKALFTVVLLSNSLGVEGASYSFSEASSPVTGNQVATISVLDSFQLDFDIVFHSVNSEWTNIFHVGSDSGQIQRLPALFWYPDNEPRMHVATSTNVSENDAHNTGDLELGRKYHVFVELRSDGVYRGKLDSTQMFWSKRRKLQSAANVHIWFASPFSNGGATDCTVSNLNYVTPIPVPTSTLIPSSTARATSSTLAVDTSTTSLQPTSTGTVTTQPTTALPTTTRATAQSTETTIDATTHRPTATWPKTTSTTVGTAASLQSTDGRSTALEGVTTSTGVRTTHSESSTQPSANATTESTPLTTSQHSDDASFQWTLFLLIAVVIGVAVLIAVCFVVCLCSALAKKRSANTNIRSEVSIVTDKENCIDLEESSESNAWDKVVLSATDVGVDFVPTPKAPESKEAIGERNYTLATAPQLTIPTPMGDLPSVALELCGAEDLSSLAAIEIESRDAGETFIDWQPEGLRTSRVVSDTASPEGNTTGKQVSDTSDCHAKEGAEVEHCAVASDPVATDPIVICVTPKAPISEKQ